MTAAPSLGREPRDVLIVDDDPFTRSTLQPALAAQGFVVTAAGSAREALAVEELPSLAMLDLHLGHGPTGMDLAVELRKRHPTVGLVLLTTYDDPRLLSGTLPTAPRGMRYLRKRDVSDISLVVSTLRAAYADPLIPLRGNRLDLSDSMLDTLRMVAEGLSTQEIAKQREVSPKAVEHAITKLCDYFGLDRQTSRNQRARLVAEYFALTGQVPK